MKPLICFDLETTGLDVAKDRIIEIAYVKLSDSGEFRRTEVVNPGIPIPANVSALHGFTDESVADKPKFADVALSIYHDFITSDLSGFNVREYDIPILWEEFNRAGIEWDLADTRIIDAGILYKKREPRTLTAAHKFYCDKTRSDAHRAMPDVEAAIEVLKAQTELYGLGFATREQMEAESSFGERRLDLAGKILISETGQPIFNLGKVKGHTVWSDLGFAQWMLRNDFSENTKMVLRKLLQTQSRVDCYPAPDSEPNGA